MGRRSKFGQWPYRQVHDGIRQYERWKRRRRGWWLLVVALLLAGLGGALFLWAQK